MLCNVLEAISKISHRQADDPSLPLRTGSVTQLVAVLILLCALSIDQPNAAHGGDPRLSWKTIETEHFVIHYHEPLGDVARQVAQAAEYSHRVLSPAFGHEPAEKTHIVITDDTDGANGFASVLPRNSIRLFASAPGPLSSLNDHDDWLFGLTAHEYTHILHLDSIGGLPRLYNRIFGKTWSPNQAQPRWVIEGIATYQESRRTSAGRTRNALFDMDLRAVTLADRRLDLDAVSNGPQAWPRGNAPYLYGSHFLKYVFDRHGEDKMRELSWSYGSNPVPYSLNRSIKNITGRSFAELYDDWLDYLRDKYSAQAEAVARAGLREGRRLTFSAENNSSPRYTRDGRHIVWRQGDGYSETRYRIMPVGSNVGRASDYATIHRSSGFALLWDGSMVLAQTRRYRNDYSFDDLYRWDRRTDRLERLTRGMRAREPAVSPDESRVAFVINGRSQTQLAVMPLRPDAEPQIVWTGQRFDQVGSPYWSPDGTHIACSVWTAGGYRDLMLVDMKSGAARRLTHDRANDVSPVFSPDGSTIFYSSDRSGIYNVYALELATGTTWQVTNVVGGAFWADISPDGKQLVYQGFGPGGYDLYELDIDRERWIEPLPYINDRPDPVAVPAETASDAATVSRPRQYRPLATLAPQSYTVDLVATSADTALTLRTSGSDAVGIHGYSLSGSLGLERRNINVSGSYTYRRLWPSLRIAAVRNASRRSGLFIDGSNTIYTRESYSLTGSIGLPVLRDDESTGQISLAYDVDWLLNVQDEYDEFDPNDTLPDFPEVDVVLAGLSVDWTYRDTRGYTYTLGPQAGQSLRATIRLNHPSLGSDFRSLDLSYTWNGFKKLPFGDTPAVALRLAGGIRTSDRQRTSLFIVGGVPEQDLTDSVLNNRRAGVSGYLRGYPFRSVVGQKFHLANLEYRQVLWNIERGVSTLPFYVRRLHIAGLLDAGNAWNDKLDIDDFKVGLGAALRLDVVLGYFVPGSLEIGHARGLVNGGIGEYWILLTQTI